MKCSICTFFTMAAGSFLYLKKGAGSLSMYHRSLQTPVSWHIVSYRASYLAENINIKVNTFSLVEGPRLKFLPRALFTLSP